PFYRTVGGGVRIAQYAYHASQATLARREYIRRAKRFSIRYGTILEASSTVLCDPAIPFEPQKLLASLYNLPFQSGIPLSMRCESGRHQEVVMLMTSAYERSNHVLVGEPSAKGYKRVQRESDLLNTSDLGSIIEMLGGVGSSSPESSSSA